MELFPKMLVFLFGIVFLQVALSGEESFDSDCERKLLQPELSAHAPPKIPASAVLETIRKLKESRVILLEGSLSKAASQKAIKIISTHACADCGPLRLIEDATAHFGNWDEAVKTALQDAYFHPFEAYQPDPESVEQRSGAPEKHQKPSQARIENPAPREIQSRKLSLPAQRAANAWLLIHPKFTIDLVKKLSRHRSSLEKEDAHQTATLLTLEELQKVFSLGQTDADENMLFVVVYDRLLKESFHLEQTQFNKSSCQNNNLSCSDSDPFSPFNRLVQDIQKSWKIGEIRLSYIEMELLTRIILARKPEPVRAVLREFGLSHNMGLKEIARIRRLISGYVKDHAVELPSFLPTETAILENAIQTQMLDGRPLYPDEMLVLKKSVAAKIPVPIPELALELNVGIPRVKELIARLQRFLKNELQSSTMKQIVARNKGKETISLLRDSKINDLEKLALDLVTKGKHEDIVLNERERELFVKAYFDPFGPLNSSLADVTSESDLHRVEFFLTKKISYFLDRHAIPFKSNREIRSAFRYVALLGKPGIENLLADINQNGRLGEENLDPFQKDLLKSRIFAPEPSPLKGLAAKWKMSLPFVSKETHRLERIIGKILGDRRQ